MHASNTIAQAAVAETVPPKSSMKPSMKSSMFQRILAVVLVVVDDRALRLVPAAVRPHLGGVDFRPDRTDSAEVPWIGVDPPCCSKG